MKSFSSFWIPPQLKTTCYLRKLLLHLTQVSLSVASLFRGEKTIDAAVFVECRKFVALERSRTDFVSEHREVWERRSIQGCVGNRGKKYNWWEKRASNRLLWLPFKDDLIMRQEKKNKPGYHVVTHANTKDLSPFLKICRMQMMMMSFLSFFDLQRTANLTPSADVPRNIFHA